MPVCICNMHRIFIHLFTYLVGMWIIPAVLLEYRENHSNSPFFSERRTNKFSCILHRHLHMYQKGHPRFLGYIMRFHGNILYFIWATLFSVRRYALCIYFEHKPECKQSDDNSRAFNGNKTVKVINIWIMICIFQSIVNYFDDSACTVKDKMYHIRYKHHTPHVKSKAIQ